MVFIFRGELYSPLVVKVIKEEKLKEEENYRGIYRVKPDEREIHYGTLEGSRSKTYN